MRVARPWALELDYTKEMMAGLLFRPEPDWPRRALLIGLGAGSLTKFLHRHRPDARLTVVEIEPKVVNAARQYFKLPDESTQLRIAIADGADFLAATRNSYDLIMLDGYDADAHTGRLDTLACYLDCKAHLSDQGLLVTNLLSRRRDCSPSVARMRQAFDDRALAFPSCDSGNAVAFAATGNEISLWLPDMRATARTLKVETGLNLLPTLARLETWKHCVGGRIRL
jgi:spermidine synthase